MSAPAPLRLGIIGTGGILERFLPGADRAPSVEVVAIASRDRQRARAFASERGIGRAYGGYDELLADQDVDAVYICLPNSMHHAWTMRALAAGKHVVAEKPYSFHPDEPVAAHDAADRAGLVLTEGFMWRHTPHALRFVELLPAVGELRTIRSTFSFNIASDIDIRLDASLEGGSLADVGTYCVNAARLVAGREPQTAFGLAEIGRSGVDERFSGILDFGDGLVGTFTCGFRSEHATLEAIGSAGSLRLVGPFAGRATVISGPDGETLVESVNPYELELEDFAAAVRGEHPQRLGRSDAVGQTRALAALQESARTHCAVDC
ncbi:MAG: Gfo/Idh/MocA family protein [Chloroflexota bacterium]